jgi:drug/metabolite transporter (DMT)-like permease
MGGVALAMSFVTLQMAFSLDPQDAGPLMAVVGADVIIFAIYCHFVYKERLNCTQWFAVMLLVVGLGVMGIEKGETQSVPQEQRLEAFAWALGGTLCFFTLNVSLRCRFSYPITSSGDFSARMLAVGMLGVIALIVAASTGELAEVMFPRRHREEEFQDGDIQEISSGDQMWLVWVLPFAIALGEGFGTIAVTQAFKNPDSASITVAIMGCCSVVLLILQIIFLGSVPGIWQLGGMALAVFSVMLMTLAKSPLEAADVAQIAHSGGSRTFTSASEFMSRGFGFGIEFDTLEDDEVRAIGRDRDRAKTEPMGGLETKLRTDKRAKTAVAFFWRAAVVSDSEDDDTDEETGTASAEDSA